MKNNWKTHNRTGKHRVIVTKPLVGNRWMKILSDEYCRIDVCVSTKPRTQRDISIAFDEPCEGAIGQLTEKWDKSLFNRFNSAGGTVYSNVAVGYDNVDVATATKLGIYVGNTPGVLTDTTAELTVALTFAVARNIVSADAYTRSGKFKGWKLDLMLGDLLSGKTLGIIGMGRIGTAYARMMAEGHRNEHFVL
jgi:glycerate dehydrogenase